MIETTCFICGFTIFEEFSPNYKFFSKKDKEYIKDYIKKKHEFKLKDGIKRKIWK